MDKHILAITRKVEMASNSFLWELTKNHSCFLVKRKDCGAELTSDPFNLTGENRARLSGRQDVNRHRSCS